MNEEILTYLIYYGIYGIFFGFTCSAIEKSKGYEDGGSWFFWGFLFGIFALIVSCAKPAKKEEPPKTYTGTPQVTYSGIQGTSYNGIARIFYCPHCNSTYGGSRMDELVCPQCKRPLVATTFLCEKWRQFSEERKEEFRQKMREGKGLLGRVEFPTESVNLFVSAPDEIKKYKELLDMGAITQEEFEAKKKQLLNL